MAARILVVDDDPIIVHLLTRMLSRDGYQVISASDGVEALERVATHQPDLVLLDVTMPRLDGFAVCRRLKDDESTALIPVTMLTGLDDQDHRRRGIEAGADDFLTKPIDQMALRARIRTQLRLKRLVDQLEHTENVIFMLAQAVEAKDPYTEGHLQRISAYAEQLGLACGLTAEEVRAVRYGGLLHDIGKIGVRDSILLKPGPLTDAERAEMCRHPEIGARIVGQMRFAPEVAPIIRHHHERWDGRGYPDGLRETQVPFGARIISIVDSYDVMVNDRPYRRALSKEEALSRLLAGRGTQFDPEILDVFIRLLNEGQLRIY
ncbi:MAG: response regulator [Chloroflexota bacterium]|nr:MAG: two-component system response regulator [Chloroflexota bacterium]